MHSNTENVEPIVHNPLDPVGGYAGIPTKMTCVPEKLRSVGYRTVASGKWDSGMASPTHTPSGRGFEQSLMYFHHRWETA